MKSIFLALVVLTFGVSEGACSKKFPKGLEELEKVEDAKLVLPAFKDAKGRVVVYLDPNKGVVYYSDGNRGVANCVTDISYVDGPKAELSYRCVTIGELCEKLTYPQVVHLLVEDCPLEKTQKNFLKCAPIPEQFLGTLKLFPQNMDRVGFIQTSLLMMENHLKGENVILNTLNLMPTLFAYASRHAKGEEYIKPSEELGYEENILYMMRGECFLQDTNREVLTNALKVMLILHAEHGTNASTSTMRNMKSAGATFIGSLNGALGTLNGDKHGKANQKTPKMYRDDIREEWNIKAYLEAVAKKEKVLYGFGHRVYKGPDPRLAAMNKFCGDILEKTETDKAPLVSLALKTIKEASINPYFTERDIFPNVDSKSWIYLMALGLEENMFTAFFALGRSAGWAAHFVEHKGGIFRPASVQGPLKKKVFTRRGNRKVIGHGAVKLMAKL